MLGLLRKWRRHRWARRPFPSGWLGYLEEHVPFYAELPASLRQKFLDDLKAFVWEKHFLGAGGLEITDEIKVVIGATAARMVLHLDLAYFDRLTEIIVYPDAYRHDHSDAVVLGEAHDWGTVVLSWTDVLAGLANPDDGLDTATHEFAHVLDRAGGAFDGTPQLRAWSHYQAWGQVMSEHFLGLRRGGRAQRKVLRQYGATDEAEFFAVATEAFFEKPRQMQERTPELYRVLCRFYGCDPAAPEVTT